MSNKFQPIPLPKNGQPSQYEVSEDLKEFRLKPSTSPIIHACPYCNRETHNDSNLVILDGLTYSACELGIGCNADYQPTWGAYFAGSLFYDIPLIVFCLIVIIGAHFIFSPFANDPMLAQLVVYLKITIYGFVSIVFPLGLVLSVGAPVPFLTLITMPLYSYWMIFG